MKGNIDIILSIPHGGDMDPKSMPDRKCKCIDKSHEKCPVVTGTDQCTIHLGNIIRQSIEKVASLSNSYLLFNKSKNKLPSQSNGTILN